MSGFFRMIEETRVLLGISGVTIKNGIALQHFIFSEVRRKKRATLPKNLQKIRAPSNGALNALKSTILDWS